jgi:hypothetical protein
MEYAVLHGCLPVIIMDDVHAIYETALNLSRFSIRVPQSQVRGCPPSRLAETYQQPCSLPGWQGISLQDDGALDDCQQTRSSSRTIAQLTLAPCFGLLLQLERLPEILTAVSQQQIRRMRKALVQVWHRCVRTVFGQCQAACTTFLMLFKKETCLSCIYRH